MKKVVFINYNFPFTQSAHNICFTNLVRQVARYNTNKKLDIEILAFNSDPKENHANLNYMQSFLKDVNNNVTINIINRSFSKNNFIGSLFELIKANVLLRKKSKNSNADLIYVYGETALLTLVLNNRYQEIIYDCRGDFLEELSRERSKPTVFIIRYIYKYILAHIYHIFVSSSRLKELFLTYNPKAKITLNQNYYDDSIFGIRGDVKEPADTVFIYSGGVADYQCLQENLLLFVAYKKIDPNSTMILLVKGKHFKVKELIEKNGIDSNSITVATALSPQEVNTYLNKSTVGLMLRHKNRINYSAFPTKFVEYLAAGLPVITTNAVFDIVHIVKENNLGIIMDLKNNYELEAQKIQQFLLQNKNLREQCNAYAQMHFSWSRNIDRIFSQIIGF